MTKPTINELSALAQRIGNLEQALGLVAQDSAIANIAINELARALGDNAHQLKMFLLDALMRRTDNLKKRVAFHDARSNHQAAAEAKLALQAVERLQQRLATRDVFDPTDS